MSKHSQRELESGNSLDCEEFMGAVDGANARASLAFGYLMARFI